MKPIIKWQTYPTNAIAKFMGIELNVKSNEKGKFEATVYASGERPEKDHTHDNIEDAKAWCEQTLQRVINANFEPVTEPLSDTLKWFELAVPEPTLNNVFTQVGCHFEEVAEMLQAVGDVEQAQYMTDLATWYKTQKINSNVPRTKEKQSDAVILDSLCDQIVTALGVGYMFGFDMLSALKEVNRSNFSKFENGKPVFDENGKIKKGVNYTKPQLEEFI